MIHLDMGWTFKQGHLAKHLKQILGVAQCSENQRMEYMWVTAVDKVEKVGKNHSMLNKSYNYVLNTGSDFVKFKFWKMWKWVGRFIAGTIRGGGKSVRVSVIEILIWRDHDLK